MRRRAVVLALTITLGSVPAEADQEPTVQWNDRWPRVRLLEGLNIIALTAASLAINAAPYHTESAWKGPILFDRPAQLFLRLPSANAQEAIATVSDRLYQGMVLAPYVIDNYFVALGVHQNADVAFQMTLINMQSLGLSGVLALGAQHAIGRARPYIDECPPGGVGRTRTGFNTCGGFPDNQSFFSGHAAAAFTMAGLTCVHHQHLPLWGGGAPDLLACTTMLALATTTGVARIMSDRHWTSDVILGTAVGLFNGYFVPLWLHYGFGKGKPLVSTSVATTIGRLAPIPQIYEGGAGLGVAVF
jgi:hypothetical protein